jgi:hypothetical protein
MSAPITYKRTPEGRIDWKAHLNVKWLRVKDDMKAEVARKHGAAPDLSKVEDFYLYVTLGGYNEVARLRGFDSLVHHVDYVSDSKAVVTCTMHFVPNEEDPNGLTVSGVASGSVYNIKPDFTAFMETIAENRAFVRAVRRALNINIVAQEELGLDKTKNETSAAAPTDRAAQTTDVPEVTGFSSKAILIRQCKEAGITFEGLQERAIKARSGLKEDPASWTSFESISDGDVYVLLGKIADGAKKKAVKVA